MRVAAKRTATASAIGGGVEPGGTPRSNAVRDTSAQTPTKDSGVEMLQTLPACIRAANGSRDLGT